MDIKKNLATNGQHSVGSLT